MWFALTAHEKKLTRKEIKKEFSAAKYEIIMSAETQEELNNKLKRKEGAPVVCAWGVNSALDPLITRCLGKINDVTSPVGLLKKDTVNKYLHPLPTLQEGRKKWVNDMVAKLSA